MLVVPGQVTAMDNNFTFWVFHEPNIGLGRNWFLKMSTLECNNGNWILGMKMRNLCMIYLSNIFLLRIWNQSLYHILFYSMVSLVSPRNTNSVNPRDDGPLDFPPPDEGGCWPPLPCNSAPRHSSEKPKSALESSSGSITKVFGQLFSLRSILRSPEVTKGQI